MKSKRGLARYLTLLMMVFLVPLFGCSSSDRALTVEEARTSAHDAYIFAFPMMENYRTMQAQAILPETFNTFTHATHLQDPSYTNVVRPNNDTLYSMLWLDLRAEPMVITIPPVEDRYISFQIVDMYTHNIAYVGTRATGTGARTFMITGPTWQGERPEGVDDLFRSEGSFALCLGRTAVGGVEGDLDKALAIQKDYVARPLSAFLKQPSPEPLADCAFPLYAKDLAQSPAFIGYFNFFLSHLVVVPSEEVLIESFGAIGIDPQMPFDEENYSEAILAALDEGVCQALDEIAHSSDALGEKRNGWNLTRRVFGNREEMEGKYLVRAGAALMGLYGNDLEEAYYPSTNRSIDGEALDASKNAYVLSFGPDEIPPIKEQGFWSLTLYDLPSQLLVDNPIDRYSIGDRTPGLVFGDDGSLTIYIQKDSPGPERESNWLPAPDGPFSLTMRLYLPEDWALDPLYAPPGLTRRTDR